MFLLEMTVVELNSYAECKEFRIKSKFADIFSINLMDPYCSDRSIKLDKTIKKKVRNTKTLTKKLPMADNIKNGQFILYNYNATTLITAMKKFPIELVLFNKENPKQKLGYTYIPWSPVFIDYLSKLDPNCNDSYAQACPGYNIYDDFSSRCIATITLNIKLAHLRNKTMLSYPLHETNQNTCVYSDFKLKSKNVLNSIEVVKSRMIDEKGSKKTAKSGVKQNVKKPNIIKTSDKIIKDVITKKERDPSVSLTDVRNHNVVEKCEIKSNKLCFVRSDCHLDHIIQNANAKTKSCSAISPKHCNILSYVFGDINKPFSDRVFYVGYFTVENDFKEKENSSKSSSKISTLPQSPEKSVSEVHKDCPSKKNDYSEDIPIEEADLITVAKCNNKSCKSKQASSSVPQPPDEGIVLDLSNIKKDCCITGTEVIGGLQAKMKYDEATCSCSCECTFGFKYKKQMTYCGVCGGYEDVGDFVPKKDPTAPFPCPVYYKLTDKNRSKASPSGSDRSRLGSGKKGSKSPVSGKSGSIKSSVKSSVKSAASGAATKDESGAETGSLKKTKKDDRFKFNYGFTGIPPLIGHSNCATPCRGTLGNVPKTMGWLWTAEDVPGITAISQGWRPGAISKRLLSMLNKAKRRQSNVQQLRPVKKAKKRIEEKPTLIVCKRNGEYIIEMQVVPENLDGNVENCSPLIYKIASKDNEERIKRKARKQRRLIRKAAKEVWSDHYNPDACQDSCFKAYKQAIGLLPFDPNNPNCTCPHEEQEDEDNCDSCSCSDDDIISACSSLDVDWELHFSPPIACYNNK